MSKKTETLTALDALLGRICLQTKLDEIEQLRPARQTYDTIAMMGGRKTLTLDLLKKVLGVYFGDGNITVESNKIIVPFPSTKSNFKSIYFTGAEDAIIADHKFALVEVRPGVDAKVTFEFTGTDARSIITIQSFSALKSVLADYWPESSIASLSSNELTAVSLTDARLSEWKKNTKLRLLVYGEVQQMLYVFLPFRNLPMMDNEIKQSVKSKYEDILCRESCPGTALGRLRILLSELDFPMATLSDDPHYMSCFEFHMERIQAERRRRWESYH